MVARELVVHAPPPRLADLRDGAAPGALARVAAIALLRLAVLPVDLLRVRVRVGVRVGVRVRVRVRVTVRVRVRVSVGVRDEVRVGVRVVLSARVILR